LTRIKPSCSLGGKDSVVAGDDVKNFGQIKAGDYVFVRGVGGGGSKPAAKK